MVRDLCDVTAEAGEIAAAASQAADTVSRSAEAVQQAVAGMGRIQESAAETSRQVLELQALRGQIGNITETISGMLLKPTSSRYMPPSRRPGRESRVRLCRGC